MAEAAGFTETLVPYDITSQKTVREPSIHHPEEFRGSQSQFAGFEALTAVAAV
jgi:hypothetical protein